MNVGRCELEQELLDSLQRRFVPYDLVAHCEECSSCAELRLVASALLDDRGQAVTEASVPSAGTMWWRIQLRRQQEAEAAARRSLLIGQAVTLSIALLVVVAFLGLNAATEMRQAIASIRLSMPLVAGLALWCVLVPVAGFVVIRQK